MNQNQAAGVLAGVFAVACVIIVIALVIGIMFLLTLQKALNRCRERNRTMQPGLVWLNLIPCLNLYWQFHTVINVGNSLQNEFRDRGEDDGSDYGKTIGIAECSIGLISAVIGQVGNAMQAGGGGGAQDVAIGIGILNLILSLVSIVLFIVYWVKIAGYSSKLGDLGSYRDDRRRDYDDDDDDDDDDYPRRRPSSDPDDRIR